MENIALENRNTFIALANMSGIACASDTARSVWPLSKTRPWAVAVNPGSPVPWERILTAYMEQGCPVGDSTNIVNYISYFEDRLKELPFDEAYKDWDSASEAWYGLCADVIFLGYEEENLYPSICPVSYCYSVDNKEFFIADWNTFPVSNKEPALIHSGVTRDHLPTLFSGVSWEVDNFLKHKHFDIHEIYRHRVLEEFRGSESEDFVLRSFENYDAEQAFFRQMFMASGHVNGQVMTGLGTLSTDELAAAAELMVNAQLRLDALKSGEEILENYVAESAVITYADGLHRSVKDTSIQQ